MTNALRAQFGSNSEFYEINFVDVNGKTTSSKAEKIVATVPLDKKLEAIYIVEDDGTTRKIEFEQISDSRVAIKNPVVGKYLFDYAEPDNGVDAPTADPDQKHDEETPLKRWYEGPLPWIAGGTVVVVAIGSYALSVARKRH